MAASPAHRFGQIIGDVLEAAILPLFERFAKARGLYLDRQGDRSCRSGKKCSWLDANGNIHDLDFVLERGGSPKKIGMLVAFIETAWRRYTKHSRNKVQEIQGAIEPLAATYRNAGPFKGAVLAGVFTAGALKQLRSLGFTVVYIPYDSVVRVFKQFGIDASSDETTLDKAFQAKVDAYERLTPARKSKLARALATEHSQDLDQFLKSLSVTVMRQIERIVILALHGQSFEVTTVDDAVSFIEKYSDDGASKPLDRYEIDVRYNNGNIISGKFDDKESVVEFLRAFEPVSPKVR
jgi:hypothetical protein